jgi:cytochrome c nitrite reductase small subunit
LSARVSRPVLALGLLAAAAIGVAIGLGGYAFVYARGASYLTNDPAACANCHVMQEHYDAWRKSSHKSVAVCNDCHAPKSFLPKMWVKARNGWNHSVAFTTQDFHEPLEITEKNRRVTEAACRRCHGEMAEMIEGPHLGGDELRCVRCHDSVGHRTRD